MNFIRLKCKKIIKKVKKLLDIIIYRRLKQKIDVDYQFKILVNSCLIIKIWDFQGFGIWETRDFSPIFLKKNSV